MKYILMHVIVIDQTFQLQILFVIFNQIFLFLLECTFVQCAKQVFTDFFLPDGAYCGHIAQPSIITTAVLMEADKKY